MVTNELKKYPDFLELNSLSKEQRTKSLRSIFDRDIANNENFVFRKKIIRPLKKEDAFDVDSLFSHLINKTEEEKIDNKTIKKRTAFDVERAKRLHWILPHIFEKIADEIIVFSANVRKDGKNVIRTFLHNTKENYIIILEPQRSGLDYYFITAYYLEKKYGGLNMIKTVYKKKLDQVY
jgi:hypothetical protein